MNGKFATVSESGKRKILTTKGNIKGDFQGRKMGTKKRVGVLYGGKSPEHEVSLQSARNIIAAIDPQKFDVVPIAITKEGRWTLPDPNHLFINSADPLKIAIVNSTTFLGLKPGDSSPIFVINGDASFLDLDVIFPVLHGAFGEDGSIQGVLKYLDIAYVGPGILGSAVGMDKDIMKRLLRDAGIRNSKWELVRKHERGKVNFDTIKSSLGLPMFIKPANLGSSVGVHRVENESEFFAGLDDALTYDPKVIIEEAISGRELECAVLGNEEVKASAIGEVLTSHTVYSYEAKYVDKKGSSSIIPAQLDIETLTRLKDISIAVYKVVNAEGLSRVDSFLTDDGEIIVNEINTIPGFTDISMYPKLWAESGLSQKDLLTELLNLGMARHETHRCLKTDI